MEKENIFEYINNLCPQGVEYVPLYSLVKFDKRFKGVDKAKQKETVKFSHVSAETLKNIKTEDNDGDVFLLSTGKFDGYTTEELAGDNLNNGEVISIPSGGGRTLSILKAYL